MAILPVHQMIDRPDLVGNLQRGVLLGQAQADRRQAQADRDQVRSLAPGAIGGDADALAQIAAIDPQAAGQYQTVADNQAQKFANWFDYTDKALQAARKSGNLAPVNAALQHGAGFISKLTGKPAPTAWTPDMDAGWEQLRAQRGAMGPQAAPDVKVVGDALVDATGRVVYQGKPQAKFFQTDQGLIQVGPDGVASEVTLGGGGPAAPQVERVDMEADIALANELIAAGIPPEKVDAFIQARGQRAEQAQAAPQGQRLLPAASVFQRQASERADRADARAEEATERARQAQARAEREAQQRQQFGTIPPGYRVNAAGTGIERVPGAPPPAGAVATEDERKAAGWVNQARFAADNMAKALDADPGADEPGFIETYSPVDEVANWSRSDTRQQYVQAASSFSEAVLRAATGAGVNKEEALQKVRELTPQRGDGKGVREQKRLALDVYLKSLEQRAGRALQPAVAGGGTGGAGGAGRGAQAAPPRRATNPQTGEVLVLVNGQWVPE